MSRCAHSQSTYKLATFPRCKRCKTEMTLVLATYERIKKPIWEWECSKCGKVVPKRILPNEKFSKEDLELGEWCSNEARKEGQNTIPDIRWNK